MIFVDASALVAIIAGDPEADRLADTLATDPDRLFSAMSVWETVAGLRRSYAFTIPEARAHVQRFLDVGKFQRVEIGGAVEALALEAYDRFGKGRHPAALNMGDCFAYAAARQTGARLLYIGDDFSRTDLA